MHQTCGSAHLWYLREEGAVAVIDRSKMIYLIYCLLGVIVFLVVAILFKTN